MTRLLCSPSGIILIIAFSAFNFINFPPNPNICLQSLLPKYDQHTTRLNSTFNYISTQTKENALHSPVDNHVEPYKNGVIKNIAGIDCKWTEAGNVQVPAIKGVVMRMEYGIGVGGALTINYNPYLLLNDGSIYEYPEESPYDLDIQKSKKSEPAKWGTWKESGKNMVVSLPQKNGAMETSVWEKNWFWTKPATSGESITGTFKTISGTGNTALGGSTMITFGKRISFNHRGQFTMASFGGAHTSDDAGSVAAYSSKDEAGIYTLNGYSIELKFNNGKTYRKLFYFYPDSHRHFGLGASVYLPAEK